MPVVPLLVEVGQVQSVLLMTQTTRRKSFAGDDLDVQSECRRFAICTRRIVHLPTQV